MGGSLSSQQIGAACLVILYSCIIGNAVCHRNYFEKGARVMVEIFDDRVDIVSPGGICKGITPENFGAVSITRNSIIAGMFYRINYIEQMGTGIRRMRNAAREANVAEPEYEFTNFFKVTFKRNKNYDSIRRHSAANRPQSVTPADKKQAIISFLEENIQGRVSDFVKIVSLSDGRVRELLREMASEEKIEKVGNYQFAYYILKRS